MHFGSVCSGIEAASVAWHPLGWTPAWFAEIEAFPSAVLAHHYPGVPNLGDMTQLPDMVALGTVEAPDILCGGTPCQAFSVAGLRRSLDDARGNLSLTFCEIANAIDDQRRADGRDPCIVFWENVPGVLNTKDNAFGCFLAGLAGEDDALEPPGGKWTDAGVVLGPARAVAWRILDAQYFGLAQRRRRVFVVASAREDFDPAQVLFEFDGVRRDSAPSREAGEGTARGAAGGAGEREWPAGVAGTLDASFGKKWGLEDQHINSGASLFVPVAFHHGADATADLAPTLRAMPHHGSHANGGGQMAVAVTGQVTHALNTANNGKGSSGDGTGRGVPTIASAMQVRRLTPRECERLQGFPDDYTLIPWRGKPADQCPDGPRYKALGNSWAVPVVRWIGARISNHLNAIA